MEPQHNTPDADDAPAFELSQALEVLRATPRVLAVFLHDLSPAWTSADEGPRTFDARRVVEHLIHGERTDWIPRATRILAHGESLAFEPFDRFARNDDDPTSLRALCELFAELRARSIAELERLELTPRDLAKRGLHPALGSVTLGQLLATWVVHDLDHLGQIARVMAKRYTSDVGPWKAYLPILTR